MLISQKHNFIFIHIYKNAGTSITETLKPYTKSYAQSALDKLRRLSGRSRHTLSIERFPGHITASEIEDALGQQYCKKFFRFAFVRNPWDWQASLYRYILKNTEHPAHAMVSELPDFKSFIHWWNFNQENRQLKEFKYTRFQKDFIYNDKGECLVDFIGKFEHLAQDFRYICHKIGIHTELQHLNSSGTEPYRHLYDMETIDLVNDFLSPDIELFEYTPDHLY